MKDAYEDAYRKKNWVIRLVDLVAFCDRSYRRYADSMLGMYFLQLRRSRRERRERRKGSTCA